LLREEKGLFSRGGIVVAKTERRDGGKEREEGESIRVRVAYVARRHDSCRETRGQVKRIWADYYSGCSGQAITGGAGGERRRREVREDFVA